MPIDGSEPALRALKEAIGYAQKSETAEIHLLHVQPALRSGRAQIVLRYATLDDYYENNGKAALASARAMIEESGIKYTMYLMVGPAARRITQYVKDTQCDHIVMGTRGLGAIKGLLLGSVTTKVIHLAPVPITLVK